MLREQRHPVAFTGGLDARLLDDHCVGLLAGLKPKPACFFAYDPGDDINAIADAARRLLNAGFTISSHRLRCYVLIGYPGDTFFEATNRLNQVLRLGFTPMAMLWRPPDKDYMPSAGWRTLQREWARPAIIHARKKSA